MRLRFQFLLSYRMTTALGHHKDSSVYWCQRIKDQILKKFEFGLFASELDTSYDLSEPVLVITLVQVCLFATQKRRK